MELEFYKNILTLVLKQFDKTSAKGILMFMFKETPGLHFDNTVNVRNDNKVSKILGKNGQNPDNTRASLK